MPTLKEPTIKQLFDLSGKVALITGGTGHLGSAMSRALAEAGASVVISSRERSRAQAAARALPKVGKAKHTGVQLDHMDPKSIASGFKEAVKKAGKVDILINNGLEMLPKDLTTCTFEEFARHQANSAGYFILARHLRDHLVARQGAGSVINLGSMYGQVASYPDAYEGISIANPVAYQCHKGGTIQMTRHLGAYWAKDKVRVNCISPGPFPKVLDEKENPLVTRLNQKLPMRRMGLPHELKGAVVYLASDASSFVTGQNLNVDGGWTAW